MTDKLSRVGIIIQLDGWRDFIKGDEYWSKEDEQVYEQIKSLLTPVPKHKIRELVENKAHKFLMDNFVNEIPPIKEMPLDETARWIQCIEKLIYSSLEAYDNLREGKEG